VLPLVGLVVIVASLDAGGGHPRAAEAVDPPAGAAVRAPIDTPADFDLPSPSGKKWRPSPALPPFGFVNTFYGGCKGTQPCGSLVSVASFKKGRMKLRAFRTADGRPPVAPRDPTGSTSMAPSRNGAAPIYELAREGVTFAWATVSPFVLEAEGPSGTQAQERAFRRSFRAWVDRVDDQSPADDASPLSR